MNEWEQPTPPPAVLGYGTHDRAGPWWRRWLRAWGRAAKPALIAAVIVAALAYSVAPRGYTAVATIDVELDVINLARGVASTPAMDAARATALSLSLKNTNYLQQVLNSPQWRTARLAHPGTTAFEPIDAEAVPGTKTIRIRFTDPDPEAARIGAEATVAVLNPIDGRFEEDPAVVVQRELMPLIVAERSLKLKLDESRALQAEAATRPATQPANMALRRRTAPGLTAKEQFLFASRRRAAVEQQLAGTPRVRRGAPVVTPRFASNQKDLVVSALAVAGLVFPLIFVAALYHGWRYGRATTAQIPDSDRIFSVADLANVLTRSPMRPLRAAARRALAPAAVAAVTAGAIACCFAPRRYTATATLAAAPAPPTTTATPGTQAEPAAVPAAPTAANAATPADAYAALAAAASQPNVLWSVTKSTQWQIARGTGFEKQRAPEIDVSNDARSVAVRFTDTDRDAARYGAEAAMTAARAAVTQRSSRAPPGRIRFQPPPRNATETAEIARADAIRLIVSQLPVTTTSESRLPSNHGEMLAAGAVPAAWAFGFVFVIALWFHTRQLRFAPRRARSSSRAPRATVAAAVVSAFQHGQPPFQLAGVAAILVGLVGYAVSPRTYTATATLRVRAPSAATTAPAVPQALPIVTSRVAAEAVRIVPGIDVETDLDDGAISINYTANDPQTASTSANAIASSLAATWRKSVDQRDLRMLFDGDRDWGPSQRVSTRDPRTPRDLAEWSVISAGAQVEVVDRAAPPFADQGGPLKTTALAALSAFVAVLFAIELLRSARQRGVRTQAPLATASM